MRIVTLIENMANKPGLIAEHGLAFYIETENKKILFDTGQSANFIKNAALLGIDILEIDIVILSHGHYDHTGGLYPFLEINSKAVVYAKKEIFAQKFSGEEKFIGIGYNSILEGRIKYVTGETQIDKDIFIMAEIPVVFPHDTHFKHFTVLYEGVKEPEEFDDELYLALVHDNQLSIISSCSHRGIANILVAAEKYFNLPINLIMGGFHIKDSTRKQSDALLHFLKEFSFKSMGVCHCTGIDKYGELKNLFKSKVFYNSTGSTFTFGKDVS